MAKANKEALIVGFVLHVFLLNSATALFDISDGIFGSLEDAVNMVDDSNEFFPCSWLPVCRCLSTRVDCSNSALEFIPKQIPVYVTYLNLAENMINDIEPGIFQNMSNLRVLNLSYNNITKLQINSFRGLGKLDNLNINGNKIRYSSTNIPLKVFQPLKSLIYLEMQQNLVTFLNTEEYPSKQLAEVQTLISLEIDIWYTEKFDETFSDMRSLNTISSSGHAGRCYLPTIKENMFKTLIHLKTLTISNCSVHLVENNSFSEIEKLFKLDLSYNTALEFKSLPNITYGIRNRHLRKLKLNSIHPIVGDCTRLEADHLKYVSNMTIKYLYLAGNRLSFVNENTIDLVPKLMEGIYLRNNRLAFGNYVLRALSNGLFASVRILILSQQDASSFHTDQIQTISQKIQVGNNQNHTHSEKTISDNLSVASNMTATSENMMQNIKKQNDVTNNNQYCSNCINVTATRVPLSKNLSYVDLSDLKSRQTLGALCFCEPNTLKKIYLQENVIWNVQGPFYGLKKLKHLNLALNSCENISKIAFRSMPNLLFLYLERNFLSESLNADVHGEMFLPLTKLQRLTLSDNKLRALPSSIFKGLGSLTYLNLSHNFLSQFDLKLSHMANLEDLSLENNLIQTINKDVRIHFDTLAVSKNLTINLSGNKFKCTCNETDLLDWFAKTKVRFINFQTYTCEYKNGSIGYISNAAFIRDYLIKECADYRTLIIAIVCTILLFLIVIAAGVIYRYRWDLRYIYYSAKTKWNKNGYRLITDADAENPEFEYDCFVSYAAKDGEFVKQSIATKLEDTRQMKLLIHDRDFRAGEFVNDNIMRAIITSRKTLIILSIAFLESHWCRFEMNMARMESIKTGRNVLCVLMKEDVPVNGLPLEIIDIIRNRTYLDIPDEMHLNDLFWDRLKDAIME